MNFADKMAALNSAEDFLTFFNISYEPDVIAHKRIHLLRMFHQNLAFTTEQAEYNDYRQALTKAYCSLKSGEQATLVKPNCNQCSECH